MPSQCSRCDDKCSKRDGMKDRHGYKPAIPEGKEFVINFSLISTPLKISHTREDSMRRQMMVTALTHAKDGPTEIVGYKQMLHFNLHRY